MSIEYKTLTAPQKSKIRKIIENILKAVGIKLPGSFTKSDEEVIRMFNTLSTKLRKGEEILEEDVKLFDDEAYTVSEKLEVKKDAKFKPRDVRKQKNIYSGIDFATEIPTLSLKEFVNRVDGNVYAVTSDATGLGYDSQGDKIDGGFGYSAITENVDGDVGFASLDMNTVKQLYGKIEGKPGDKVGILIMIQKPSATLGNYYGAKFLGRGLQQLQKESPNTYDQVASSLINVIKGNKTIQNAFADTKKNISQEKLINLILNPNNYSEVEFAKEFIKDTTFNVRRILTKSVVPKTATTRTNKSTPVGKVKLQEAGYSLSSFLEEYGDNRLLSKDIMDGDQGGFIVGGFEMVIPDNVDEAISEVEKRGLTHPQFNGKIPSNGNNFIFDGLYPINENFQGFAKPNIGIVKDTRAEVDKIVNRKFKNNLDAYEKKFLEGPKKVNKKDLNYTHLKEKFKIEIKEEIGKTRPELLEDIPAELVSAVAKGTGMVLKERIPYDTEFSKLPPRQKRAQIIGPSAEMSGEIQDGYIVAKSLYDIRDKYKDNKELLSFVDSDPEIKKNAKATDTFDPKRIPFDLKSPTEIFYETGWIRGEDGKYRYEIPNGKLREDRIEKLKGKNLKVFRMNGVPLKDIFDAPELFKLYPELKDITVKSANYERGTRGGYVPLVPGQTIKKDGLITLNERFFNDGYSVFDEKVPTYKGTKNVLVTSDEMLRLVLIHEIQHAIQNIEGFAKGTNPDDAFYKIQKEYGKEFTDMLSAMYTQNRVASDLVALFEYIPAPVFSGKVKDIVDFKSDSIGEYIVKILNLSKDSNLYNKMEGKVSDFYLKRGGERLKKQYEDKKPTVYSNQITSAISTFYEVINDKPLSKKEILDGTPKAIDFINEKIFMPLDALIKLDIVKPNDKSSIYKAFSEVESKNAEINEKYFTPYQLYVYTYGEAEARNAAKRELIIKDLGREAEIIVKAEMMGKEVPQEVYDKYEKALEFLRQPFINTEDIPQYEKKWILPSPKIGRPKRKVRKQLAPNGQPSNLTPEQYKLVRTPAFKRWFGDWETDPENASKVVDENGEPMVMYHGSPVLIEEFDPSFTGKGIDQLGSGFYFTTNESEAEGYAEKTGEKGVVLSSFLKIKNPIIVKGATLIDSDVEITKKEAIEIIKKSPLIYDKEESPIGDWIPEYWEQGTKDWMIEQVAESFVGPNLMTLNNDFFSGYDTAFREALVEVMGRDGVKQEFSNGITHYVAYLPTQIKLADGSNVTFDPEQASVRKQLAPMDATMQDLIAWGRARNLPDVQIRELLIERNMGTVKEINKALREVVEYMAMPREMADILGGVKQGEKLFKEVMEEFYSQTMEVRDVSESEEARRKRAEKVMKDTPELYKNQTLDPEVAEKTKGMKLVTVQSIIGSPRRFQRVWIKTPAQRREILQKLIDKNPIYQKQPDFTQAQIKSILDRTLNSTANPSVEQQIKALKDLLKAVRNKEKTIEEYRKELKNIINNTLPTVRNVKNFNRLNRLLTAASKVNEKNIIAQSDKVTKIINEIRAQERNERKERIVKLIKAKAKPKAGVDADTQGFFQALKKLIDILEGNDVDNQLDAFKINLEDSEIESIVLKYLNNEKLTSEERSIMFEDYAFELLKDFNEKTVEELDSLFDDLSLLKKEGIDRFKTNRQKRISKYKALQVQVDKQIAQDYKFLINEDGKFLNEEEILARKQEIEDAFEDGELYKGVRLWIKEVVRGQVQSKSSWFKQYLGSMQTLTNSFDNKSKGNTFFTDNVYQKMRDMRDKFLDGEQKQTKIINDIAASIKGIKTGESKRTRVKKALLGRELSPYGQIVEYLAGRNIRFTVVYEGANGRRMTRRESLTRDQALRVYALSKNDVQRDKLMRGKDSKGEGTFYSEENLKYIEDELNRVSNGVLIEFADKVVSYLSNQYFDEINDVYRESNDSNLNRIDNYFPTKTYETSYNQKDIMGQNFHRIFSAETAPALKSRIDTKGRINVKEYAFTSELFNHLEQMEKFKAYALGVKELNAIFNFESVKTLMRTSRLSKLMDLMIKADIAPDQITLNHFGKTWLSKAFRTFTSYALSFKIWQIPKQASSFINAYEDYDSGINTGNIPWLSDTAKEVVDVVGFMYDLSRTVLGLSGDLMPQKMKDGINKQLEKTGLNIKIGDGPLTQAYKISPTFRDRIQQSMANDMWGLESGQKVRRDRQGITYTPKLKRITSKYKKGFRTVGNSPTMLGDALGVMGYMINYRADIRRGMSQEEALKKFNRYEATQQTRGTTEKNYLQLQSNDLTRMFTMFGSTQFLQMNKVVQAAKNIAEATGQGIMPKKKDVRSLLINGAFANLFFSLASRALQYASDDDEDQIEALKDMKKTLLGLNLLKQLPMLGDAVAFMEQKGSGKRFSADPIVNPYLSLVQKMYYNIEDKNWDKMTKEVWGIYAGVDVDPFIGMYNWLIANDSMPIDFYKAIGIAKSYQPKEAKEEIEVEKPPSRIRPTRDQIRKEKIKEQLKLEKESRDLSAWDLFFSLETAILPLYEEEKKAKKEKEKEEEKEKLKEGSRRRRKTRTEIIREQEAEEYKRLKEEAKEKQKRKRRFY